MSNSIVKPFLFLEKIPNSTGKKPSYTPDWLLGESQRTGTAKYMGYGHPSHRQGILIMGASMYVII
jgi:hypothetical protein